MTTLITLYEGVLNDDTISVAKDGKALLEYWTYSTEWNNKLNNFRFENLAKAVAFYQKTLPNRVFEQGKRWLEEGKVEDYPYTPEEFWQQTVYEVAYA